MFAVGGWGSLFRCRCGGRRRRNREGEGRGGEGRQRGDILTFTDRITDIIFSSVIPSAILPVKGSLLNPSVISLVKSPAKTSTSLTCFFFFKILYILSVILSVYTTELFCQYIPIELPRDLHQLVIITTNYG